MERINTFRPELKRAFEKMILGVNVQLSDKGKSELKGQYSGSWFFIIGMSCDETITIEDATHSQWSGLSLDYIKL